MRPEGLDRSGRREGHVRRDQHLVDDVDDAIGRLHVGLDDVRVIDLQRIAAAVELKLAGLDVSKYGKKDIWAKWERTMIRYKARSMALRSKFADLLAGIHIAEYDDHTAPEFATLKVKKNGKNAADRMNEEYALTGEIEEDSAEASVQ